MSDLDGRRIEHEARRDVAQAQREGRYSGMINRYLGMSGYGTETTAGSRPPAHVATPSQTAGLVVVGVDESPSSYIAVDHAAVEAELRGSHLRVLHVQHSADSPSPMRSEGASLLDRLTARVHACSPNVPVSSGLVVGSPGSMLLAAAEQADLIVVGSRHGRAGGALRLTVGDYVAMHHRGPVLVVRMPAWPPGADYGARPIVVGVQHVPASTPVLPFALTEARLRGCEVIAMHIAGGELASADRVEDRDGVLVHHRVIAGDPASALIATSGTAAALVMGRRGHEGSGLGGPLGSVSRSLLQHAHCPVFLVG